MHPSGIGSLEDKGEDASSTEMSPTNYLTTTGRPSEQANIGPRDHGCLVHLRIHACHQTRHAAAPASHTFPQTLWHGCFQAQGFVIAQKKNNLTFRNANTPAQRSKAGAALVALKTNNKLPCKLGTSPLTVCQHPKNIAQTLFAHSLFVNQICYSWYCEVF